MQHPSCVLLQPTVCIRTGLRWRLLALMPHLSRQPGPVDLLPVHLALAQLALVPHAFEQAGSGTLCRIPIWTKLPPR